MLRKKSIGVILLGSMAVAANAAGVATFTGTDLGGAVTIGGSHYTGNVFAGLLDFHDSILGNFKSFCVDLDHVISNGQSWGSSVSFSNANSDNGIKLAGNLVAADFAKATTNDKAEGLQLAIWEARYDGGATGTPDFTHGSFTASNISSGVLAAATSYWADVNKAGNAYFIKAVGGGGQDQMTAVPEPASIAALCIGGLALVRRRKAAKKA